MSLMTNLRSATLLCAALVAGAAELQPGLVGEYFTIDKPDTFPVIASGRQPTYVRVDPKITFDEVTEGKFYGTKLSTNFYARWSGIIRIAKPGVYEFALISDDGSRLAIGGKTVVDNGGIHPMQRKAGTIELAAGDHPLLIEFVQGGGGAGCVAWWTPPGGSDTPIPASVLFHPKGAADIPFDKAAWDKMPGDDPVVMTNEYGPFVTHTVAASFPGADNRAYKGVVVKLREDGGANLCFDTDTLRVSCAWDGGYLRMPRARDGLEGHPKVAGQPVFGTLPGPGWAKAGDFADPRAKAQGPLPAAWAKWKGLYLDGRTVVLSYTVGSTAVLESPALDGGAFVRHLNVGPASEDLTLLVAEEPGATVTVVGTSGVLAGNGAATGVVVRGDGDLRLVAGNGRLHLTIPASAKARSFALIHARGEPEAAKAALVAAKAGPRDLAVHTKGGAPRWGAALTTALTEGSGDGAYVVDTIAVPYDNQWKSYMRTSGFDFFADGRAAVCTIDGDVWLVSGFGKGQTPSWRRFATGMFQPLGLKVVDGKVHVLGREQLTVLHDLNNDGEADFYQNLNNDCIVTENYHEFSLDLQTDKAGNFYYAKGAPWPPNVTSPHQGVMMKVAKDGSKLEVYATGLRAPNGLGMGPNDELTFSDNQGHWIPACKVSLVKAGGFYGMTPAAHRATTPTDFDKPLFWLPMNMDNSSGGQGWVAGDKWGPFDGQMLHTAYGKGTFFICYHEVVNGQAQGGAVKLPLNFISGIMRIRQHPVDGQIYVVGMRGWQTSGTQPGAFQRIRYTGKPVNLPKTIRTQKDALAITFTDALAKDAASPDNLAIEAWNYHWSGGYGSPELKPSDGQKGHDKITPSSVTLSPDGKTLTIGLPGLKPVDQLKIKYKLETAAGEEASNEIYYTINAVP
jgi:glucose/arabinose dehydrogenase